MYLQFVFTCTYIRFYALKKNPALELSDGFLNSCETSSTKHGTEFIFVYVYIRIIIPSGTNDYPGPVLVLLPLLLSILLNSYITAKSILKDMTKKVKHWWCACPKNILPQLPLLTLKSIVSFLLDRFCIFGELSHSFSYTEAHHDLKV